MDEHRYVVSDGLWRRLEPHLPGKASDCGGAAKDNSLFLEAVFSRSGPMTRIVALVDALGNLVRFLLLPGQAPDRKGVAH